MSISPTLLAEIREELSECDQLRTNDALQDLFMDGRLSTWRYGLPEASNLGRRVEALIAYLRNKKSEQDGNALAVFLRVLSEQPGIERPRIRHLAELANEVEIDALNQEIYNAIQGACTIIEIEDQLRHVLTQPPLDQWDLEQFITVEHNKEGCKIKELIRHLSNKQTADHTPALIALLHTLDQNVGQEWIAVNQSLQEMILQLERELTVPPFEDQPDTDLNTTKAANMSSKPGPKKSPDSKSAVAFETGHAIIVGVGDYPNNGFANLPATVKDAKAVADVLQDPARCGYPAANVQCLVDEQATADKIRAAFKKLQHTLSQAKDSETTTFIYFSGHGGQAWENQVWQTYLCPRDADPQNLAGTAISGEEFGVLLSDIRTAKLVVVLDACHAEGAANLAGIKGAPTWKAALPTNYYEGLSEGSGRVIIASSRENQFSYIRDLNASLFTHHLVQALSSEDLVRKDGMIHVLDVFNHVEEAVKAENALQVPFLVSRTENFPIALGLGGKKTIGPSTPPPMKVKPYSKAKIRALLKDALPRDIDVREFCQDYYEDLLANFSANMSVRAMIDIIFTYHGDTDEGLAQLLEHIKTYLEYAGRESIWRQFAPLGE